MSDFSEFFFFFYVRILISSLSRRQYNDPTHHVQFLFLIQVAFLTYISEYQGEGVTVHIVFE